MGAVLCKQTCADICTKLERNQNINSECPWYSDVEVDWNGCRKFPRLPPPGEHPRLFFTAGELPSLVARFTHSEMGPQLCNILDSSTRWFRTYYETLQTIPLDELQNPRSRSTIDAYFKSDCNRNETTLAAYVYGVLYDDEDLVSKVKDVALFYSRVILRSREIAVEEGVHSKPYDVWHSTKWDLGIGWLFGGHAFALLYDLIFNDLAVPERNTMRDAICSAVRGRRGWGMGWPSRRIQSNWASYHGDLLALAAAVEEEEGFDREVYSIFCDLMVNYLDYAFYDSGHPIEDAYVLSLGFREGSLCFLIMARRGHNIFNHPHYKKVWTNWLPYALEPNNSGKVYGGSSGNNWDYPTSAILAKYTFPKDPCVDYVYRHYMCENGNKFSRLKKHQSRIAVLIFAIPALSINLEEDENPEKLNMPLNFVCRNRGKVVMRSDWSENALWFTLDARPDAFLIGHDTCSRGAFVVNVDGRSWGFCPEWKWFDESTDYSLPAIDRVGQRNKAPFVKLLGVWDGPWGSTFASADITYAYNWMWTTWAKEGQDHSSLGFEPEPNDPRDFGHNVWWSPNKLYGERDVGFVGLYEWRQRFATVQKVFRSTMLIRATKPYVLIADDVKKDENTHVYSWSMTTPEDVELLSFDGKDAILIETGELQRRFLVRCLVDDSRPLGCEFREISKLNKSASRQDMAKQVVFSCYATSAMFRFMLFSLPNEECRLPMTRWDEARSILHVCNTDTAEEQDILFETGPYGEPLMTVVDTMTKRFQCMGV